VKEIVLYISVLLNIMPHIKAASMNHSVDYVAEFVNQKFAILTTKTK